MGAALVPYGNRDAFLPHFPRDHGDRDSCVSEEGQQEGRFCISEESEEVEEINLPVSIYHLRFISGKSQMTNGKYYYCVSNFPNSCTHTSPKIPMPISSKAPLKIFLRWFSDCIQSFITCVGVSCPFAIFSPSENRAWHSHWSPDFI